MDLAAQKSLGTSEKMYGRTSCMFFGEVTTPERNCWLTTELLVVAVTCGVVVVVTVGCVALVVALCGIVLAVETLVGVAANTMPDVVSKADKMRARKVFFDICCIHILPNYVVNIPKTALENAVFIVVLVHKYIKILFRCC